MPRAKVDLPAVHTRWKAGMTDTEIATALGWDRETVRKNRDMIGLPPAMTQREIYTRQLARADENWLGKLGRSRRDRIDEAAACYGLPSNLTQVQVAVVVALAGGPQTAEVLANRTGRGTSPSYKTAFHRFGCRTAAGKNHLTGLRRLGLITYVPQCRGSGNGSGRGVGFYVLTAAAMAMLIAAGQKKEQPK